MLITPTNLAIGGVKPNAPEPSDRPDPPGEPAEPRAHGSRSRSHTLRGVTTANLERPPSFDAAPSCEHAQPVATTFDAVPVLSTTAVHGGWGSDPSDRNASEPARWSERSGPDTATRNLLSETLREFQPRQRADSTLRTSLVRSAVTDPRDVPQRSAPSGFRSIAITVSFALWLLAVAFAARLPVTSTLSAHGVVQHSIPGEALVAPVAGIVREISGAAAARVAPGQRVVIIDPVDVRAQLAQTLQQLGQIEQRQSALRERQAVQRRGLDALRAQAVALRRRYDDDGQRMARLREQRRSYERLVQHGFASPGGLEDLAQLMQGVWRDVLSGEQDIANNRQQQLALEQERTRETQALQTELDATLATRHALEDALERATVLAPRQGRLEGPLVKVGERVESEQLLARVVPLDASMRAMLEVSAPERVRLRAGAKAMLTVEEPGAAAWTTDARISAVHDAASGTSSAWRVEVEVDARADVPDAPRLLAPGTHVAAALSSVPRPLLTVALEEWAAFTETL